MDRVCIYLRKSRADEERERELGEGETLQRHRLALLRFAKDKELNIVEIKEELVSGDELFFRPKMIELLKEVEEKKYDAVLCMDLQRLGRGDSEEQGLILKTFKKASVRIITPNKTYNLSDEFDEEYAEFEAFMGRKEYRMIKRRMQGGRIRSVQEGNYIGTFPPYGYNIAQPDKNTRTLEPHPEQAPVVKMIYDMYVNKMLGMALIVIELNKLGIKPYYDHKVWERSTISTIIKNPVYIGKVKWQSKIITKSKKPGQKRDYVTRPRSEWILADGKHPAIIDVELWNKAQEILQGRYHVPFQLVNGVSNPLAGLVICKICGKKMARRPYKNREPQLRCVTTQCPNKSTNLDFVEKAIIAFLEDAYTQYKAETGREEKPQESNLAVLESALDTLKKEIDTLEKQKNKAFDLLEQNIYTTEIFLERTNILTVKIEEAKQKVDNVIAEIEKEKSVNYTLEDIVPQLQAITDAYWGIENAEEKNILLKSVIDRIVYYKSKAWRNDQFELDVELKLKYT